jgi:uncharacterized protein (TIGR03086 family)
VVADIRELDRRAVAVTVGLVGQVRADQLDLPTPCAAWTLRQLLEHMIGQHHGFAAAADGETVDRSVFDPQPLGPDWSDQYAAAAARVTAAFAADGVLDRRLWLPEIRDGTTFPAPLAIGFHFLDYVVHGWDVARSIGTPFDPDPDLIEETLDRSTQVPDGAPRLQPDAAFGPKLATPDTAATLDRLLATLGRSPAWPD